jgi:hypothetical protein
MPLGDVMVHLATPIETTTDGNWEEGEPDEIRAPVEPFDCFYMQGRGASETPNVPRGRRKVEQPTILYEAERDDGSLIQLSAEDEIVIDAEEVLGIAAYGMELEGDQIAIPGVLFQVDGDPEPFQPPGEVIGYEARLKRVVD